MKTIFTSLPIYDKLSKQCYERAKKARQPSDSPVPIICPRHRLPSFQWNAEDDDMGSVTRIELIDVNGDNVVNAHGFNEWHKSEWFNIDFGTFTNLGLNITSCIAAGAGLYAHSQWIYCKAGDIITISGTFTKTSGNSITIALFDLTDGVAADSQNLITSGPFSYESTVPEDDFYRFRIISVTGAVNCSLTNISISTYDFINYFGGGMYNLHNITNLTYTTLTRILGSPNILSATKTVAAGEDNAVFVAGIGSIYAYTNVRLRIDCSLTLNSGTAPKMVLRDAASGLIDCSNIVTLEDGRNIVVLVPTINTGITLSLIIYNSDTELTNFSLAIGSNFLTAFEPHIYTGITDEYYSYSGNTLSYFLDEGLYYLKITMENDYILYSDWFEVTCVYPNLITGWTNIAYDTFTSLGTIVTSAIRSGIADGRARSNPDTGFYLSKGESIRVVFFHTQNSGDPPRCYLFDIDLSDYDDYELATTGLNDITLTASASSNFLIRFWNNTAANWYTSEILVMREYSEKYLTINFSNVCDLGDILYADGFEQTIWFESETMEPSFPQEEQGVNNGEGQFVRSFARQVKKYMARTLRMPSFMVDVFNRMKLHDTVEMIDLVGDVNDIYNLEVEHEWLEEDKYYTKIDLTFDYNEAFVIAGCCNNLT